MSDNNFDDAATLFATKRKKIQEEEAQKAEIKAAEAKKEELELQKQQVAEEIKRLEALQAQQKELEERLALAEQRAAEREAADRAAADKAAAKKAEAERAAAEKAAEKRRASELKATEKKAAKDNKNDSSGSDKKNLIPYICIGVCSVLIVILVIILLSNGPKISDFFTVNEDTGLFEMDRSLFGLSYSEFKDKIGAKDLMEPEAWEWWSHDLEVAYVIDEDKSFVCIFQNNRLVIVYRESETGEPGKAFDSAVTAYGKKYSELDYWTGFPKYVWELEDCYYWQYVETYDKADHFRQQYVSFDYDE